MTIEAREGLWTRSLRHPYFGGLVDRLNKEEDLTSREWDLLELYEAGKTVDADSDPIVVAGLLEELLANRSFANHEHSLWPFSGAHEVEPEVLEKLNSLDLHP